MTQTGTVMTEELYRKWIGICQQSKVRPLVLRFDGDEITISIEEQELVRLQKSELEKMSANDIVKLINRRAK